MFSKVYEKIIKFLKENIIEIIIFIIVGFLGVCPLPYYIDMPGGLLNTKSRVDIENKTIQEGSYNLAYVSEMRATPALYLIALINPNWDIVKEKDMTLEGQSVEELYFYQKLLLQQVSANAKVIAYQKASKSVEISNQKLVVGYVLNEAKTDLKVGDIITKIDGNYVSSFSDIQKILDTKKVNDVVTFEINNDNTKINKKATLQESEGKAIIGIGILSNKDVITNPNCKLSFENKESGPSGGLMTALTIYDYLVDEDLTHGLTISGTGTIEDDGTVGSIGGVKYKLAGVVKKHADIFLVPAGENYEEAIKLQKEKKYDIKIVPIATFDEAIEYLEELEK